MTVPPRLKPSVRALQNAIEEHAQRSLESDVSFEDIADEVAERHGVNAGELIAAYTVWINGAAFDGD